MTTANLISLPPSIWLLAKEQIPSQEISEIVDIIGSSLIDEIEDLRNEASLLLEILREFSAETESLIENRLPEPPAVRDNLSQEIRMFCKQLDIRLVFSDFLELSKRGHNVEVIKYALAEDSRPVSARSIFCSQDESHLERDIQTCKIKGYGDRLNYFRCEEIRASLQSMLQTEVMQLRELVTNIRQYLDGEIDFRQSKGCFMGEPSLTDLRKECILLEKAVLSGDNVFAAGDLKDFPSKGKRILTGSSRSSSSNTVHYPLPNLSKKPSCSAEISKNLSSSSYSAYDNDTCRSDSGTDQSFVVGREMMPKTMSRRSERGSAQKFRQFVQQFRA